MGWGAPWAGESGAAGGGGGPPTGPAGGDLSGTYPNPYVASISGSAGGGGTVALGATVALTALAGAGALLLGLWTGAATMPTGALSWAGAAGKAGSLVAGTTMLVDAGTTLELGTSSATAVLVGNASTTSLALAPPITGLGNPLTYGLSAVVMASDANLILSAGQKVNPILRVTSSVSLTTTRQIILPNVTGAQYEVFNNTTGAQALTFIGASGSGVTVANGLKGTIYFDGTNWVPAGALIGGDLTSVSNTSQEVTGLLTHALPALATGYLNWTGSAWALTAGGSLFTPGGDLTGNATAQYIQSISGASDAGGVVTLGASVVLTASAGAGGLSLGSWTGNTTLPTGFLDWSAAAGLTLSLNAAGNSNVSTSSGTMSVQGAGGVTLGTIAVTYATIGATANNVVLSSNITLSASAGTGALSLGSMTGATALPTGNLSWAGAATKTGSLVAAGAFTITAGAASTWSSSSGALTVDSAAALNLGTVNATSVVLGNATNTTAITANLSAAGDVFNLTVAGTSVLQFSNLVGTATAGAIYAANVTPSATNALLYSSSTSSVVLNAPSSTVGIAVAGTNYITVTSTSILFRAPLGGSSLPIELLQTTQSVTGGAASITLSSSVYDGGIIRLTGTLSAQNMTIILPSSSGAIWLVDMTGVTFSTFTITLQANSNNWGTTFSTASTSLTAILMYQATLGKLQGTTFNS